MRYDYLIVGAGLFGSVFAQQAKQNGKTALIIDKREHIGGNCYTSKIGGIDIHKYGPHIFHTSNTDIWNYINQFDTFNQFIYSPIAKYNNEIYPLPFNMFTFNKMWGVNTPEEAKNIIEKQKYKGQIKNLEDQARALVGDDIYEILIKDYTIKQWEKHPKDLPAFIIKRLPVRFSYDNNYFNDTYQGIPKNGYTHIFNNMLSNIDVVLNTDYINNKDYWNSKAKKVVYTGPIDRFYDYKYGKLEYRSLRFEEEIYDTNQQGICAVYYTSNTVQYTRTIEHKFFNLTNNQKGTVISKEYPSSNGEPYYPINTKYNQTIYDRYRKLANKETKFIFGGRLAEYRYYDMHQVIAAALKKFKNLA